MLNQKNYLRLSVCKSNIKNEATYYARVCKNKKIGEQDLIKMVSKRHPYLEDAVITAVVEALGKAILECIEEGADVDLFGLGTVGLKGKGSIKMDEAMAKKLEAEFNQKDERAWQAGLIATKEEAEKVGKDAITEEGIEGSYEKELCEIAKESVEFAIQFSPSRQVKKHIKEHVEPSCIVMKLRRPKIRSVEKVYSGEGKEAMSIIKIKGEDLKLVGDKASLYIKTKNEVFQISKEAIIHNEPKTLMFITNLPLQRWKGSIYLSTQYARMGCRQTQIIRRCEKEFCFEREGEAEAKKAG